MAGWAPIRKSWPVDSGQPSADCSRLTSDLKCVCPARRARLSGWKERTAPRRPGTGPNGGYVMGRSCRLGGLASRPRRAARADLPAGSRPARLAPRGGGGPELGRPDCAAQRADLRGSCHNVRSMERPRPARGIHRRPADSPAKPAQPRATSRQDTSVSSVRTAVARHTQM